MEGGRLISLGPLRPCDLPEREEMEAFIAAYFPRVIPGFRLLATDARWGDCSVDVFGQDGAGTPIAIFLTVSGEEPAFLKVVAQALHAASWLAENRRVILVVPALSGRSRAVGEWLERSGLEVMEYSCYEFERLGGEAPVVLRGISLETRGQTVGATSAGHLPEPGRPGQGGGPGRAQEPVEFPEKTPSVETFIAGLADEALKRLATRIYSFLLSLFPDALGVVGSAGDGFTVVVEGDHVASVHLDQGFLWVEAGPERIPTGRITDSRTLEKVMNRLERLLLTHMRRGKVKTG